MDGQHPAGSIGDQFRQERRGGVGRAQGGRKRGRDELPSALTAALPRPSAPAPFLQPQPSQIQSMARQGKADEGSTGAGRDRNVNALGMRSGIIIRCLLVIRARKNREIFLDSLPTHAAYDSNPILHMGFRREYYTQQG